MNTLTLPEKPSLHFAAIWYRVLAAASAGCSSQDILQGDDYRRVSVQVFKLVLTELISVQGVIQFRALRRLSPSKLSCRVLCSGAELFLVLVLGFESCFVYFQIASRLHLCL